MDPTCASATALANAIRRKEVSSREVVSACLQRIDVTDAALNAVVQRAPDALAAAHAADEALARGEAPGVLHGVPCTIKDNIDVAGLPTSIGTIGRAGFVPPHDAAVVWRLRAAGAIVIGKTNMPDLGLAPETDNLIYGRTNNPYDLAHTPGGSSGGEAAIIAAGGSPFGIGNDSGGSLRIPAHWCGVAALKPTTGRVPKTTGDPAAPLFGGGIANPLWQHGPIARRVEDLALVLPVIAGPDAIDPSVAPVPLGDPTEVDLKRLRVAFYVDDGVMPATAEVAEAVRAATAVCEREGMFVEAVRPPGIDRVYDLFFGLYGGDGGTVIRGFAQSLGTAQLHPLTERFLGLAESYAGSTANLLMRLVELDAFRAAMFAFMARFDALIGPLTAFPAPRHGASLDPEAVRGLTYATTFNLTGWPAATVRAGSASDGLPIGVQIAAGPWREDVVLAIARLIENVCEGWRPPPVAEITCRDSQ